MVSVEVVPMTKAPLGWPVAVVAPVAMVTLAALDLGAAAVRRIRCSRRLRACSSP